MLIRECFKSVSIWNFIVDWQIVVYLLGRGMNEVEMIKSFVVANKINAQLMADLISNYSLGGLLDSFPPVLEVSFVFICFHLFSFVFILLS